MKKEKLGKLGMYTGLHDKNKQEIRVGDKLRIELEDGEIREFLVKFETVKRTLVTYPEFDDKTTLVYITAVVFEWEGYKLFPCANKNGISDTEKMEIVTEYEQNKEKIKYYRKRSRGNKVINILCNIMQYFNEHCMKEEEKK